MWRKPPAFWQASPSLSATLLSPVACIYHAAHNWRYNRVQPTTVSVPVICVGNVTVGGSGKTPVALYIAEYLKKIGKQPAFLSRGYGGSLSGPVQVDIHQHSSTEVGDEPLLLAKTSPTWVSHDRVEGAKAAIAQGADLIIMDDGFQNPSLHKDISLLVVDGGYGFGNAKLLPAGPLRESLDAAFARSHAVIIIGKDTHDVTTSLPDTMAVFHAAITPDTTDISWKDTPVLAFAGIGNPQKFFDTLHHLGVRIDASHSFPDHYPYKDRDIDALLKEAEQRNVKLITTEKDWVRLPKAYQAQITYLPIMLTWKNTTALEALLKKV